MKKGNKRSRALLAGLLLAPGVAAAIGVGPIQVQSGLGQRLKAQVELLSVSPDEVQNLTVRLAPPQAFAQAGLDRVGALSDLQFAVEAQPGGRSVIRITSQRPVREPALNFLVELGSPRGRLMREFAILLDPVRPGEPRTSEPPTSIAAPATAGSSGSYGPVRSGETLWSIADRLRPAGMPNREAVRRLYEANPEAFSRRSVDGLRAGAVLRMPADAGWQGIPPVAAPRPVEPVAPPPVVSTPVTPPPAPAVPPPAQTQPGAQVRLLPPDGQLGGGSPLPAPGLPEVPRGPDPVAGGGYGHIELENGRLRLQAAGLDHLQNRLDTLPPADRLPVPVAPAAPVTPAPQPSAAAPAAPAPTPVAARAPVNPVPPPEPEFLDSVLLAFEDPLVLAGLGVAVLALLGGGLVAMRRARSARETEREAFENITLTDEEPAPVAAASPLPAVAGAMAEDPLERSQLLMSMGNHAEARAVLESALQASPDNTALRMRLLEVLHAQRDAQAFRREVGPLRQLVYGDTDPMWLRVARMGRELCPEDPLFVGTIAAAAPVAPVAAQKAPPLAAAGKSMDVDEVWRDLDFKPMDMPAATPATAAATQPKMPVAPVLDPPQIEAAATFPKPGPSLDFEPVAPKRPAPEAAPVRPLAAVAPPEDLLADLGWNEVDLGTPPAAPAQTPAPAAADRKPEAQTLAFDDDLAAFLPPRQSSAPAPMKPPAAVPDAEADELADELADDLGFSFQPVAAPMPAPVSVPPLQPAATAAAVDHRGEDEFVETKLDLALAYIDMDDPLGAKGLLEEVMQEGGSGQRARAQALLERLAS